MNAMNEAAKVADAAETRVVRMLQCWPRGNALYLSGDVHAPDGHADALRVHEAAGDAVGRPATGDERLEVEVQERAELLLSREVYCNDSSLVTALMGGEIGDNPAGFQLDDVENLRPDPSEWDVRRCHDWLEAEGHSTDAPAMNAWDMDRVAMLAHIDGMIDLERDAGEMTDDELRDAILDDIDSGMGDDLEEWRTAVRDAAEDADVFQWWRVSPYLLDVLRDIGAVVLDNDYGEWWGRTCCGQGVIMDGTLQDAARFIEQRHRDTLATLGMR